MGNPARSACFLDESYNGVVASIARSCHASNFEGALFVKLRCAHNGGAIAIHKKRRRGVVSSFYSERSAAEP